MTTPPTFFVDLKKGEVNEIKAMLRNPNTDKDPNKRKEILKKVVALMTMGVDMSELFADIVVCSRTKDLVQKKLIYLFITNYAHAVNNQQTALLAVNTLQTDCRDEDPMIRGLALRTLCSLRVRNLIEYSITAIRPCLNDVNAYVRRVAVLGVLKMYHISPSTVNGHDLTEKLYDMLRDRDAQVVVNTIHALNEMNADRGGMVINKTIIHHLLNRIKEFSEWQQATILAVVARYTPESKDELFDIMNLLEDLFRNSNSALVLSLTKAFLNLSQSLPAVHEQVMMRLKTPLITLMASGTEESAFCTLSHLKLLISRSPAIFTQDYKHFFCRSNDLSCTKQLKVDILVELVTDLNLSDIIGELSEYATDIDATLARHSIRAIGRVALNNPAALDKCTSVLKTILSVDIDYVCAETITTLVDLIRKYPEASDAVEHCVDAFSTLDEEPAKVAVIWMLGAFGDRLEKAPYIIESIVHGYSDEPPLVKAQLLSSCVRLFFLRPPEMKPILGNLLSQATQDNSSADCHDRALFYVRLLQRDLEEARRICTTLPPRISKFPEDNMLELQDRLFEEFNTLSILYNKPSEQWQTRPFRDRSATETAKPAPAQEAQEPEYQAPTPLPMLSMDENFVMDSGEFEQAWAALRECCTFEGSTSKDFAAVELVDSLKELNVRAVAFGDVDGETKCYLYSKQTQFPFPVLTELIMRHQPSGIQFSATVKSRSVDAAQEFGGWFEALLERL
eukprot:c8232_g1_i1.p1 GENE.c8232_g1_i1~~c8232_g1_i1.p1  ORF type:complete len:735 (-),score=164.69 c8232_g1_i1:51-2255(-)